MKRYGQYAVLKPERVNDYVNLHKQVWQGVLETIRKCNIQNYSIYIKGVELFSYFEYVGDNFEEDMKLMADDPITQEWWRHTKPCFAKHSENIYYIDLEEIFHSD